MPDPVDRRLVGFADAPVSPASDAAHLGSVRLEPGGPFEVRSTQRLTLIYTVGHHGLDDRGAMKVAMRFPADGGAWQLENPSAPNHVTVSASRDCDFRCRFEAFGNARPWFKALTAQVVGGCLRPGDTVTFTLSITLQTFCEDAWELRFLVDPCATGHFVEVTDRLSIPIVPGPPTRWLAVAPTRWPVGEPFRLGIKAEDAHGNPSDQAEAVLQLQSEPPLQGLPATLDYRSGTFAHTLEGLVGQHPGVHVVTVTDATGQLLARTGPIRLVTGDHHVWGDLHGQSGETVGINTAAAYYRFARDRAFLDVASHQGNAFQITGAFWTQLNELSAELHEPGRFVTVPGYEWSGNTAVGGDRNVYFAQEGRALRRSSHALLLDRSDLQTDCTTAAALFEALAHEDCVVYAHVGGRWADIELAHDERLERAVEIHSAWGTFEWIAHDAFDLGHRMGIVANSDGHKGRPGASYPGASTFGAIGGLTCFTVPELTRSAVLDAIRQRRTVATTGTRLDLQVHAELPDGTQLPMGTIHGTHARRATVHVEVSAASPVAWVEIRLGKDVVHHHRPYDDHELGHRVAVRWQGARYRGRGRQVHWDGTAQITGATIERIQRINAFNPDHAFHHEGGRLQWQAVTTGNFGGFDVWLGAVAADATLTVHTEHAQLQTSVVDLPVRVNAGGLGMALSAERLPDHNPHTRVRVSAPVDLREGTDSPLWVCVTLEDGHQAWSSPIYLHPAEVP
ncbi:MAG: hypothetical protein KTR31_11775 [Myxococcales bacterium]|nr:hypothetical protein [Myxococcales bacterium]